MLSAGIIFLINFSRRKKYALTVSCTSIVSLLELILGVFGTLVLFFLENGFWSGTSFFGAVLLLPVFFYPIALIVRENCGVLLDLIAPSGLMMYAVNKLNCYVSRCCNGRRLGFTQDGIPIYFPSQIVELIAVVAIASALIVVERKNIFKERLYPLGLILYGIFRFILNFFREEWVTTEMYVPFGTIWSVLSVLIGITWMYAARKKRD